MYLVVGLWHFFGYFLASIGFVKVSSSLLVGKVNESGKCELSLGASDVLNALFSLHFQLADETAPFHGFLLHIDFFFVTSGTSLHISLTNI